jgi:hypothetical protein
VTTLFFVPSVVRAITRAILALYLVRGAIFVATGGLAW